MAQGRWNGALSLSVGLVTWASVAVGRSGLARNLAGATGADCTSGLVGQHVFETVRVGPRLISTNGSPPAAPHCWGTQKSRTDVFYV